MYQIFLLLRCLFHYPSAATWADNKLHQNSNFIFDMHRFFVGLDLTIHNRIEINSEKRKTPMLIISNHQSLYDIIAMYGLFPKLPIRFIFKASLRRWFPYISLVIRTQQMAGIDRNNQVQSITAINKLALYTKFKKTAIAIFPEGTRSRYGDIKPFHNAAIRSILKINPQPVAIVAIHNGFHSPKVVSIKYMPKRVKYHIKLLKVYSAPKNKQEVLNIIEEGHRLISEQIKKWDEEDTVKAQISAS